MSSPRAMVADNDYAVGEVVDAVSHSKFWKSSAIFVVEDDAQAGFDHVDCHRSNVLVVSPFLKRDAVDSSFYNTDSILATIESLFHCNPHNQYLATARPFDLFSAANLSGENRNDDPYQAIVPSRTILSEINSPGAYRSSDSEKLLTLNHEETGADLELNDILWHALKGSRTPVPKTPGAIWHIPSGQLSNQSDRDPD